MDERNHSSRRSLGFAIVTSATVVALGGCITSPGESTGESGSAVTARHGIDYAWSHPSPSTIRADGYTFAVRYLSYDGTKDISAGEAHALEADGVDVVANWEAGGTDALDGYSTGVAEARQAEAEASAAGMPAGRPIYFSIDFDATPGDQAAINSYFDGVASVLGRNRTGAYGGYYVIQRLFDAGKITWGWQTYAWSGGQWDSRAHLRQIQNDIIVGGVDCDEDEAMATDFGQWSKSAPPPPPPPPGKNCTLAGHSYATNTCTETLQCDNGSWVARTADASNCRTGIESGGACLTDSGSVEPQNTCTSSLQCDNGVWVDRATDAAACDCALGGKHYATNTCTETKQCDDGSWVARASDASNCLTGIESGGACLTDTGTVDAQNTCTSTLQCDNGVWVDRFTDLSSCR